MKRYLILFFLSVLIPSLAFSQIPIEDELYATVLSIEGRTHLGRGDFIKDQLHMMGIGYVTAPFKKITIVKKDTVAIEGENIMVRTGKGTKRIIVGAHYDAFANSPGANDNGSGVAVVLALIKQLHDIEWNYAVDFCFFDQEESGLVGSLYYINQFIIPKQHLIMINLDNEGSGEEVFIGPIGNNNKRIIRYVREAEKRTGFPSVEHSEFPRSDHESFAAFNLENIAISIVPKGDADRLAKYERNKHNVNSIDTPEVLKVIHTVDDRSDLVSPASLKMSYEFTKSLLMLLNESRQ